MAAKIPIRIIIITSSERENPLDDVLRKCVLLLSMAGIILRPKEYEIK
jgi:hypothetical protein